MAGAKELRSRLNEEFLTCQICLNVYKDPVSLDCQHSFCRECVGQCLPNLSNSLHCPVCRQKTSLQKKHGISALKKNFFLQSLIDTLNERRPSQLSIMSLEDMTKHFSDVNGNSVTQDEARNDASGKRVTRPLCDNCEIDKGRAVARCLDCTDYLCRDCELVHCQTKFTKKHKVVRLKELLSGKYSSEMQARAKVFCLTHPEETCKSICEDCHIAVCHECLRTSHKDHKEKDLKVAVAHEKERALNLLESAASEEVDVSAKVENVMEARAKLKRVKRSALEEIQHRTKAIVAAAKAHEDKLTKLVKAMSRRKKEVFTAFEEQVSGEITHLENKRNLLKAKCDDVLAFGTPSEILALKTFSDDVEEILTQLRTTTSNDSLASTDADWKLAPVVSLNESPSFVLDRVKPTLKSLIGHIECTSENKYEGLSDSSDDDVVVIKSIGFAAGTSSSSSSLGSFPSRDHDTHQCAAPDQTESSNKINDDSYQAYCHMKSITHLIDTSSPPNGCAREATTDEEELTEAVQFHRKIAPLTRNKRDGKVKQTGLVTSHESPSLNLMRKFPPICQPIEDTSDSSRNGARKNGVSDSGGCAPSRGKLVWRKSDAAKKSMAVTSWRNNRSKSADKLLDDESSTSAQAHSSAAQPDSSAASPTNTSTTGRGRARRRSLPGSTSISTVRALSSPGGEDACLLQLATSPVAALAENPERLGVYEVPDPTSDAAVASLTQTIATAPYMEVTDAIRAPFGGEAHSRFSSHLPMGSDDHVFVKSFQSGGKTTTFRSAPKLSVTSGGHVVATDYKAQRVFTFSSGGNMVNSIKTKVTSSKCLHPISATTTKKGKLLVACGDAIYKFTSSGKLTKKLAAGCFRKCCSIATDTRTGKLIVTDIEKRVVSVHNEDGGLERIFKGCEYPEQLSLLQGRNCLGTNLEESLQLKTPYFVAVDPNNSNIIVSDWANNDVKVFNAEGRCLACLSSCNPSPQTDRTPFSPPPADDFSNPAGVCCDSDGNLFVADHGRHRVAMFDRNRQFQRFIATGANGLQNPWSLAAGPNRRLYVSEYWSRAIKKFTY